MRRRCCRRCCRCVSSCCCPKIVPIQEPVVQEPVVDEPFFSALSTPAEPATDDGLLAKILAALAILAMLFAAWYYLMPMINNNNNMMERNYEHPQEIYRPQQRGDENMDLRLNRMEREVSLWGHRTWLLGLANNENSCLAKRIDAKHHPCENNDYIFFNSDWSTNRPINGMSGIGMLNL